MKSAVDIEVTQNIKVLVLGAPFTGKTTALRTLPGQGYVFDFDGKVQPLTGCSNIMIDTYTDIDIKAPLAFRQAQNTVEQMIVNTKKSGYVWFSDTKTPEWKIDWIALDSTTELLKLIMNQVLFLHGKPGTIPQVGDMGNNDFTTQRYSFQYFIARLKSLPCTLILNCHERTVENESAQLKMMLPDVVGNLKTALGGMFQCAFRSGTRQMKANQPSEYVWLTQNTGRLYAGHVFGDALNQYEPQDFGAVFEKIHKWAEKQVKTAAAVQ
jgi:GTPase SAR1 family protein